MTNDTLHGVIIPVITPLTDSDGGSVDEAAFCAVINRCIDQGANAIFVGGSAGMGPLLPRKTWCRAMEVAREAIGDRAIALAGAIAPSTPAALEQIDILNRIGYSMIVVTPTFYITLSRKPEFLAHFRACREAIHGEMIAYNIPSCTGSSVPIEVLIELVREGAFRWCKESSNDMSYLSRLIEAGSELGLRVFQGGEPNIAEGLSAGACGLVPVCGNYDPSLFVAIYEIFQRGDMTAVHDLQKRISDLREVLLLGEKNWLAGVMYAVSRLGLGNGCPIAPIQKLDRDHTKEIDALVPSV